MYQKTLFILQRDHPLNTYATWREGDHPKCAQLSTGERGVTPHMYPSTCLFSCFWQHVCLMMSCIVCWNLILISSKVNQNAFNFFQTES